MAADEREALAKALLLMVAAYAELRHDHERLLWQYEHARYAIECDLWLEDYARPSECPF